MWPLRLVLACCFAGPAALAAPFAARADGDAVHGKDLVLTHCARCHVVGDHNPYGGIGNSPSFHRLVTWDDGIWRVSTFFQRPPHPVFVRVEGVPRRSDSPPTAATFRLSQQDLEDIVAFAKRMKARQAADD